MKVEAGLVGLKSKLSKPCRKILHVFKFKFRMRKAFSIKSLWARRPRTSKALSKPRRAWSWLRWLRRAGKMERVRELKGGMRCRSDGSRERLLFPSPMRRKAVEATGSAEEEAEEVEDACRSFENYLVEMIIEEGKVRDLMDVEELLYCWRNLKCPVFVDLVCRFYGELCKDLFSPDHNEVFTPNLQPNKR